MESILLSNCFGEIVSICPKFKNFAMISTAFAREYDAVPLLGNFNRYWFVLFLLMVLKQYG